jgi:hypothetical protein
MTRSGHWWPPTELPSSYYTYFVSNTELANTAEGQGLIAMAIHLRTGFLTLILCCGSLAAEEQPVSAIVVLGDDEEIRSCVEGALKKAVTKSRVPLRLAESDDHDDPIRKVFYPWLEADDHAEVLEMLSFLSGNPIAKDARQSTGLRYLILTTGQTQSGEPDGAMTFTSGGFVGVIWWDKTTNIRGIFLDLANPDLERVVEAQKTGTTRVPALVLPIPIPARTQGPACKELAGKIVEHISIIQSGESAESTN